MLILFFVGNFSTFPTGFLSFHLLSGMLATLLPVPARIASSKSLFTGSIRRRAILVIRAGTGMLHDA